MKKQADKDETRPGGSRQPGIALGGGGSRGLALTALLLFALNMRGPITALAPVIGSISSDLRLSAAVTGLKISRATC